jgi:hypothetical protein
MGFTLQSLSPPRSRTPSGARSLLAVLDIAFCCSEDQKITMPRSFKVLLPAEIRTPATAEAARSRYSPGLFHPPPEPEPFRRGAGFPDPSLLRSLRPPCGRGGTRRSRALPNGRVAAGLAARDNSLEVLHQIPALGFSREPWRPTDESAGQEHPCDTEPNRLRRAETASPPEGGVRTRSEERVRRSCTREGPGVTPRGASLIHHVVKEKLSSGRNLSVPFPAPTLSCNPKQLYSLKPT